MWKILQVNKFNCLKGGADRYFLELSKLLQQHGHSVAKLAMRHPDNQPSPWQKYFVSQVNYSDRSWNGRLKSLGRLFYSLEVRRQCRRLLSDFRPQLAHIHNIYHQLSPSFLPLLKQAGVPAVMHLHDYKLLSPDYRLFSQGQIDESACGGHYYRCVLNKSVKNSYAFSLAAALSMYWQHNLLNLYEPNVDLYIAPSRFVRDLFVRYGYAAAKIRVVPHYVDAKVYQPNFNLGDYWLYFGRLDETKGVDILIKAYAALGPSDKRLVIAGAGAEHKKLRDLIKTLGLDGRVDLIGPKYGETLKKIVANSLAVVVPSRCYEVFGLVNLEAAALGKLVIAADIGGISEALKDHHTGLLFKPNNVDDLSAKLAWCLDNQQSARAMAQEARVTVERDFNPDGHYQSISALYRELIKI